MNIAELGVKIDSADAIQAKTSLDEMAKAGGRAEQSAVSLMNEMQALEKSLSTGAKTTQDLAKQRDALAKLTKTGAYGEAEFTKITAQLDKQQVALAKSTMDEQKALNSLLGAIDPARAALAKLDKQVEDLGRHLDAGRISQDEFNSSLSKIDKDYAKLEKTATGFDKLRLGTRQAQENVVQLGNALSSGDWGSGMRAVAQLGAGAGASAAGLLAILAPIALAIAAVGALGVAYYKGSEEQDSFNKSLILTGNYAGVSAGQLGDMARQVGATVGTTGQAAEALALLAGNGKIAGESFLGITQAAVSMREATGKAIKETVAEFEKIADEPVKASVALNEQYHYLTASVYSQIAALEKQGDHAGAVKLATEQYADTINERTPRILENLSFWEKGYNAVTRAADSLKNLGRPDIDADIDQARRNLEQAQSGNVGAFQNQKKMVELYGNQLNMLEDQKAAAEDIAKWEGEQAKAQRDAVTAMGKVDALSKSAWTNEQKRADALKEYKRQLDDIRKVSPNDARLNQGVVDKNIANINDQFKDPKTAAGAVDLTSFNDSKNALNEILSDYRNAQKELDAAQKAGLVSQSDYLLKRQAMIGNQRDEVTAAYEAEISALEATKGKAGTSAAQRIQLDQKISDARSAMVKAQKDSDSELAVLAANEEGRLKKQALAVNTYTSALQRQVETLRQQGIRAASGLGQGDRQRGLTDQQNGIDDRINQQQLDLANQYGDGSRGMSLDEYTQKLNALKATQQDLHDTVQANYDDMTAAQGSWSAGASSAWQNYLESARDVAGQTKSLFTNAFSSMEDAIVNFAMTGKLSFADFTKSILADMARIATRAAASSAMEALFGLASSAAGSYFGGGASSAGSTQAGYSGDLSGFTPGSIQAKGGAWSGGVQMFANGGAFTNSIVSKPTAFGMAGGGIGVMGEAGEEAIMPLTRTAGGQLGVRAISSGGGGGGNVYNFPVAVSVQTSGEGGATSTEDRTQLGKGIQQAAKTEAETAIARGLQPGGAIWRVINGRG
ncbi:Putative phage tail length tape measure protein [Pseudomonas brassicacearum subsp. brassicacearum NFM421]|uniref:Putative phage tail length tape measure protein n=1 Tax=Pseudomonas brassicacearum (strain NFM421) TaxID=994484 RepID=F2KJE8_PSEBN|nr:phage tail tape measure protein [Pseudomonas brassicacearum]AEA70174.1 Putative phage tail length tape measure protein [Pseudomonas brassicacearum subsp. brassicacearum NFM421]